MLSSASSFVTEFGEAARVGDDDVDVLLAAMQLLQTLEGARVDLRLDAVAHPRRIPFDAGELLEVEVGEQGLVAAMRGADREQPRERALADTALLADETDGDRPLAVLAHASPPRGRRVSPARDDRARRLRLARAPRAIAPAALSSRRSAEIFHFVKRADFDLGWTRHRGWASFDPVDRLVEARDLPDPVARHEFVDRAERPWATERPAPSKATRAAPGPLASSRRRRA